MNKIEFVTGTKKQAIFIPSSWNELSLEELLFVAPRVMFKNRSEKMLNELVLFFLRHEKNNLAQMNMSQLKALWAAVDWLYKTIELSRQMIPSVRISGVSYRGLQDGMADIRAQQFAFADKYMNLFLKNNVETYLNLLIANLYVPEGEIYKKELVEDIAVSISTCSLDIRMAMLAFYLGCRGKISKEHPVIFKKQNKVKHSRLGWMGLFYDLAGPKTGTYEDVANDNLFNLFAIMYKLDEEAQETERRLRKNK